MPRKPKLEIPRWRASPVFRNASTGRSIWYDKYRRVVIVRWGSLVLEEFPLPEFATVESTGRGLSFAMMSGFDVRFSPREVSGANKLARMRAKHHQQNTH